MEQIKNISVNQTITEHRAPTDESVKLLNEFEQKAKDNIIQKIHLKDSWVDAVAIKYQTMFNTGSSVQNYWIRFRINDKEFMVKGEIPPDIKFCLYDELLKKLSQSIAIQVATELLPELQKVKLY